MFLCKILIQKQAFAGVAHRRALRLGIDQNGQRHGKVGGILHINVAVSRTRLDDGYGCVLHGVLNQRRAAARDQNIHDAVHTHQFRCSLMRNVLDQLNKFGIVSDISDRVLDYFRDRGVGKIRVLAAAQYDCVSALDREGDRVRRDVGARLVNDAENAHRHAHALQFQTVVQRALL